MTDNILAGSSADVKYPGCRVDPWQPLLWRWSSPRREGRRVLPSPVRVPFRHR